MISKGTEFAALKLPRCLVGEWSKVALAQNDDLGSLIERNPPPPGRGFLFTMFPDRTGTNPKIDPLKNQPQNSSAAFL